MLCTDNYILMHLQYSNVFILQAIYHKVQGNKI